MDRNAWTATIHVQPCVNAEVVSWSRREKKSIHIQSHTLFALSWKWVTILQNQKPAKKKIRIKVTFTIFCFLSRRKIALIESYTYQSVDNGSVVNVCWEEERERKIKGKKEWATMRKWADNKNKDYRNIGQPHDRKNKHKLKWPKATSSKFLIFQCVDMLNCECECVSVSFLCWMFYTILSNLTPVHRIGNDAINRIPKKQWQNKSRYKICVERRSPLFLSIVCQHSMTMEKDTKGHKIK